MLLRRSQDPFSLTADPRMYVPRPATERAVAELVELLQRGELTPRLAGPPGLGKTLLLHLLPERLGTRWRCAYMGYPKLTPDELWIWVAEHLGLGQPTEDAARVVASKAAEKGGGLVLMIDDAQAMPEETRRLLAGSCAREPGLRVVLTDTCEPGELGQPCEAQLVEPMTVEETEDYISGRLERAGLNDADRDAFDELDMARVHELTDGVPARVHYLATSIQRGDEVPGTERTLIRSLLPDAIGEHTRRVGASLTGALAPLLGSPVAPSPADADGGEPDGASLDRPGGQLARSLRGKAVATALAARQAFLPAARLDTGVTEADDAQDGVSPATQTQRTGTSTSQTFQARAEAAPTPPTSGRAGLQARVSSDRRDGEAQTTASKARRPASRKPEADSEDQAKAVASKAEPSEGAPAMRLPIAGPKEKGPSSSTEMFQPSAGAKPDTGSVPKASEPTKVQSTDRGAVAKAQAPKSASKVDSAQKKDGNGRGLASTTSSKDPKPEAAPSKAASAPSPKVQSPRAKKRPTATRRKTSRGSKAAKARSKTKTGATAAKNKAPTVGSPASPGGSAAAHAQPKTKKNGPSTTPTAAPSRPGTQTAAFVASAGADATGSGPATGVAVRKVSDKEAISEIGEELELSFRRQQQEVVEAQGQVAAVPTPRAAPEALSVSETTMAPEKPAARRGDTEEPTTAPPSRLARWRRESFLSVWGAAPLAAAMLGMVVLGGSVYQLGGWGRSLPGSVDSLDRGLPLGDRGAGLTASDLSRDPEVLLGDPEGSQAEGGGDQALGRPPFSDDVAANSERGVARGRTNIGATSPYGPEPTPGFAVQPAVSRPQAEPLPPVAAAPPEHLSALEPVAEVARAELPPTAPVPARGVDPITVFGASASPSSGTKTPLLSEDAIVVDTEPLASEAPGQEAILDSPFDSEEVTPESGVDSEIAPALAPRSDLDSAFVSEPSIGSGLESGFESEPVSGSDGAPDFVSVPSADFAASPEANRVRDAAVADEVTFRAAADQAVDPTPTETPSRVDTVLPSVIETEEPPAVVDAAPLVVETGRLSVNARPWAEIEIDGKKVGETPLGEIELSFGNHEVVARFPSGEIRKESVEVGAKEVFLVLRP